MDNILVDMKTRRVTTIVFVVLTCLISGVILLGILTIDELTEVEGERIVQHELNYKGCVLIIYTQADQLLHCMETDTMETWRIGNKKHSGTCVSRCDWFENEWLNSEHGEGMYIHNTCCSWQDANSS